MLDRLIRALLSLAKNAVPAVGVLARGWSAPDAMLLYLGENVVLALLAATTVRMLAPAEEVIEGKNKTRGESLQTFFLIAGPFTFGAAIFTTFVIYIRDEFEVRPRELVLGFAMILAFQLIAFVRDLGRLRGISLAHSEDLLVGVLGRVFLLAFAVWAGLLLAMFVAKAFLIPFLVLKTIVDLWSLRPEALRRRVMTSI